MKRFVPGATYRTYLLMGLFGAAVGVLLTVGGVVAYSKIHREDYRRDGGFSTYERRRYYRDRDTAWGIIAAGVLLLTLGYGAGRRALGLKESYVEVDYDGLTWVRPTSKRKIAWTEVESATDMGTELEIFVRGGGAVRIPNEYDGFPQLIELATNRGKGLDDMT